MKHLIVYSHLNPESFTKAIVDEIEKSSTAAGNEVKVVDLYSIGFDPVMQFPDIQGMFMGGDTPSDVKAQQELITWADHFSLVFPLWWGQMPAMMKGYIDRVYASGFAFQYTETGVDQKLKGKSAKVFVCHGSPDEYYQQTDMHKALKRVFDDGVLGFCGIDTDIHFYGNVAMGPDELRKGYLADIAKVY
ncbi:NAD(P)H-dependent oxidoreductase [Flammeovirga sp. SubArs3]|uniref:NAD(P)H-dependent oxidoreductase n=1 Tax=Flammeovirga sp. SubArs3 TaxID=2995316 RepID=UPI00248B0164|nr:NAD(P)H-dependent oxidoreductase [Flammeovirga sp. SubArs3]